MIEKGKRLPSMECNYESAGQVFNSPPYAMKIKLYGRVVQTIKKAPRPLDPEAFLSNIFISR
jgi:hypothetical protein